nr:MAG TPA: hypothetical protein [Caudoviricetes sp.]
MIRTAVRSSICLPPDVRQVRSRMPCRCISVRLTSRNPRCTTTSDPMA